MASSAVTPAAGRGVDAPTIAEAFRRTVAAHPAKLAIRTIGDARTWTWEQLRERVDDVAGGLAALGLGHGDTIAIMLGNRAEFHVVDLAAVTLGAVPFSLYPSDAAEQIAYVVGDAGARIAVAEQRQLERLLAARARLPALEHVVVVDGSAPPGCIELVDVEGANPSFDAEAHWRAVAPDDVLTLVYTSGATGPPKGVQLSHRNLIAAVRSIDALIAFPDGARLVSWLPSAHVAERTAHHYLPVVFGLTITPCPDPRNVVAYLPDVRPSWFFAVPMVWEKLMSSIESMVDAEPEPQRGAVRAGIDAAIRKVRLEQRGEDVPGDLALAAAKADEAYFSILRERFGLDRLAAVNVGAAPTPRAVIEFFHAIGIPLAELWGMAETCGCGTVNPRERIKIGTVGPPAPGVEVRLAADGELLVRSDVVMVGYRADRAATAAAIDGDGWLHTGDVAEIDEDGYVTIVDRKSEIMIATNGRNISPTRIESALKAASPLVGHAVAIGDARPHATALIALDADFAALWAARNGCAGAALAQLADDARVRALVDEAVAAANARLGRAEQVRAVAIVPGDWPAGGDELTATLKPRRRAIATKYAATIERLYADGAAP